MTNEEPELVDTQPQKHAKLTTSEWRKAIKTRQGDLFPDKTTGPMSLADVDNLVSPEAKALAMTRQDIIPLLSIGIVGKIAIVEGTASQLLKERSETWSLVDPIPNDDPPPPEPEPIEPKPKRKRPSKKNK